MSAPRAALFVTDSRSSFRELAELARLLQESGAWSSAICIVCDGVAEAAEVATHRAAGVVCVDMLEGGQEIVPVETVRHSHRRIPVRRLLHQVRRRLPVSDLALRSMRQVLYLRRSRALMDRFRPDLVVLSEQNVEGMSSAVVRAAHETAAVVAILPNTLATASEPAQTYASNPAHAVRGLSNRLIARLYPRWVHEHEGRRLLRLPAAGVLATQWLGLAPPLPWQINSGDADAILIESAAVWRYFARAGLPPDRLRLTGTPSADRLARGMAEARGRRAQLCERLGIDPLLPLVLTALPPNQLDVRAQTCDFGSYTDLLRDWIDTLAAAGACNLVLSLHPRSRIDSVRPFEGPAVRIATEPVIDLIPSCDLFAASVSATIRWAIACGKPVLNFDVYRYRYDDYSSVEGVVTVESREAFAREAQRMLSEPAHLASLARKQEAAAPDWGRLDGGAAGRILALFDEMTARRQPGVPSGPTAALPAATSTPAPDPQSR